VKTAFIERIEIAADDRLHEILLIFSPFNSLFPEQIASDIEDEVNKNLTPDEFIFVVPEPTLNAAEDLLSNDEILLSLFNRFSNRTTITLKTFNVLGVETHTKHIDGPRSSATIDIATLSRRIVTSIFNRHGGFVESTSSYHFENPSKRHTEKFIRLSNILVHGSEIAFFGYCCLPFISKHTETIFIDTPALYSVVSAINDIRRIFELPSLQADNFRSYDGFENMQPIDVESSIVLISASSSGGLASKISAEFAFPDCNFIHFLYLGSKPNKFNCVCDLGYCSEENPEGILNIPKVYEDASCEFCNSGSIHVRLRGDQFDIIGPRPEPIEILKAHAPKNLSQLMKRLVGKDAASIGLGVPGKHRHRDVFFEIDGIFSSGEIARRANFSIQSIVPASVTHVIQTDEYSQELAELIIAHIEKHNGEAKLIKSTEIDNISSDDSTSIVVVAGVIESGRCLTDISRDLRSVAANSPITYIIGIEKSTGLSRRENLQNTLSQCSHPVKYGYHSIEKIILPSSSHRNAWNEELEFFQRNVDINIPASSRDLILNRIDQLTSLSQFMKSDIFLPTQSGTPLTLQPGFVFWPPMLPTKPHTQADVFMTIASVLQQLRANSFKNENTASIRSNWFHQTILDPSNFARFNDDIIQASFLRAAQRREMNYQERPIESRELGRIICRIVVASDKPRGGAAAEFLLAICTGRLKLCTEDTVSILEVAKDKIGLLGCLYLMAKNELKL